MLRGVLDDEDPGGPFARNMSLCHACRHVTLSSPPSVTVKPAIFLEASLDGVGVSRRPRPPKTAPLPKAVPLASPARGCYTVAYYTARLARSLFTGLELQWDHRFGRGDSNGTRSMGLVSVCPVWNHRPPLNVFISLLGIFRACSRDLGSRLNERCQICLRLRQSK